MDILLIHLELGVLDPLIKKHMKTTYYNRVATDIIFSAIFIYIASAYVLEVSFDSILHSLGIPESMVRGVEEKYLIDNRRSLLAILRWNIYFSLEFLSLISLIILLGYRNVILYIRQKWVIALLILFVVLFHLWLWIVRLPLTLLVDGNADFLWLRNSPILTFFTTALLFSSLWYIVPKDIKEQQE